MTLSRHTPLKATKRLAPGVSTLARTGIKRTPKDGTPGKPLERKPFKAPSSRLRACPDPEAPKPAQRKRSNSPPVSKTLRTAVLKRDRYCCIRCGRNITGRPYSLQHRDPKGAGGSRTANTLANLVTLCGSATTQCHGHVESYRIEARDEGYLVPDGYTPEEWSVKVLRRYWRQPGKTWEPAQPHPQQIGGKAA